MRPQDFDVLSRLLKQQSGLVLTPDKAYLLESRLVPVARKWNLAGIEQLADALRNRADPVQIRDVTEAMTVNESFFFRDTKPFDLFRDVMLPAMIKARAVRRSLRIWSAAASSGQEAYSLSMLIKERGAELDGWHIEIVGTDLSSEMVDRARSGIYTSFEVQRGLPVKLLVKYFAKHGDKWQISEAIRRSVQFRRHNLLHELGTLGVFDIVFCRNVLIYFDVETKAKVLGAIRNQTAPDGYLVLGAAETVMGITDAFAPAAGAPGLYQPNSQTGARLTA
jgi:chemotaxis protein methyltransferase CheR